MSNRIQIELKDVRLLNITKIGGYSGSAIFPPTYSYFYRVTDNNNEVYIINTFHELKPEYRIKASVVGESEYKGETQIKLTRVSILTK